MMKETTKIVLGLAVGVIILVGGIIVYQNNKPKPKPHPDAEEDEYMQDDDSKTVNNSIKSDDSELGLLERRVALFKVRDDFKDPSTAGYEEYIQKTKAAIEETHKKGLVFHNLEDMYVIEDYEGNIKGLIKK